MWSQIRPAAALALLIPFTGFTPARLLQMTSSRSAGPAHGQSVARLQQASGAAVSTLLKVMLDANTPATTKVRAADSVLNHSAKAIELEDIEVRVDQLERAAEASQTARTSGEK